MLKVELQFTMIQRRGHRNLNQRFEIVKTLGQGTYGKVKLAVEKKTGRQYAIKSIRKKKIATKQDLGRIRREIEIMSTLGHPHIISVYEVFENSDKIILVMEYASGGELYDYINRKNGLSTSEARRFFRQIVSAVHYLHMHNIVHRDLKLENIVLDKNGNVKIADFGLSNIYADDHMLNTFCGSPLYASPEIVNGQPYSGPEVDCWSLGVLLYTFVYGAMPFDGSDFQRLRRQITDGNYMEPRKPSDATGLIRHLLTPDPKKRATIEAICRHWWINLGYDCTPIEQYPPIKLIDVTRLGESISLAHLRRNSSSDSDGEIDDTPPIQAALPVKGILKKTKSVSTDDEDDAVVSKSITSQDGSTDVFEYSPVGTQKSSSPSDGLVMPDLNRKPRRGILKNKQPSYSDSGCGLDDTELLLVAPSGGFECQSKDSGNSYDLSDIEAVLGEYNDVTDTTESAHHDSAHTESVHINGAHTGTAGCLSSTERTVNGFDAQTSACESRSYDRLNDGNELPHFYSTLSISSFAHGGIVSSTPLQPVKGILKRRRKLSTERDPTWRYSLGSQGSNSSGDILDFSFDSADTDTYLSDYLTTVAETKAQIFGNGCLEAATDDDDYGPPPPLPRTAPPQHRHSGIYIDNADNIPVTQNGTDVEDIMSRLHVGPASKMTPCVVESVDFFDLAEARQVCQQALTIGSNWG